MKHFYSAIPEWDMPESTVLVWPEASLERYYHGPEFTAFFEGLIGFLTGQNIRVTLLVSGNAMKSKMEDRFRTECAVMDAIPDIWIKDWAPIPARDRMGKPVMVMTAHNSLHYLSEAEVKSYQRAKAELASLFGLRPVPLNPDGGDNPPLCLDGGNFVHDGRGTAVSSSFVLADNTDKTLDDVRGAFSAMLGIDNLILPPVKDFEDAGHADGLFRFLDSGTLIIETSPPGTPGHFFSEKTAAYVMKNLREGVQAVRPWNNGNAITGFSQVHFFRHGSRVYLPVRGGGGRRGAVPEQGHGLMARSGSITVIPAVIPGLEALAQAGGGLNGVTWPRHG